MFISRINNCVSEEISNNFFLCVPLLLILDREDAHSKLQTILLC